jgi:hypothetical protein
MRGARGDIFAGSGWECRRASGFIMIGPANTASDAQFFEFGWSLGHVCGRQSTNSSPLPYIRWSEDGVGPNFCNPLDGFSLAQDSTQKMRASDINANTTWGGYIDGIEINGSVKDLDFSRSEGRTLVVAYAPPDANYGVFHDLQEYHDDNQWSQWDDVRERRNSDPVYRFDRQSPNDHRVVNP